MRSEARGPRGWPVDDPMRATVEAGIVRVDSTIA
jgi:hypothetical protein